MTTLESLAGRNVLVTGASGFLGMHLCRRLRHNGAQVYGISRTGPTREEVLDGHWLRGDIADISAVETIFKKTRPEVVFHLSGHGVGAPELDHVMPTFRNDLATTVNVLIATAKSRVRRLVMAASLEEPQGASDPIPSSPYAAAKWASSTYARMFHRLYDTPVVMTRPMMTYGPGQRPHKLIPHVALALLQGQVPTLSSGTREVDWIYVDDVIDGMLAAAVKPGVEDSTIDLGSGVLVSIRDVVLLLAEIVGAKVAPQFGVLPDRPMEKVRVANMTDAYKKLGWRPRTSLRAGLEQTIEWYRKELAQSRSVQHSLSDLDD
jgi:UDP-glucose 4-epimerase